MKTSLILNKVLIDRGGAVITEYDLFWLTRTLVINGGYQDQNIRTKLNALTREKFHHMTRMLLKERFLRKDEDFKPSSKVYRVADIPDAPAEDIAALVDPFCYVSHLSAMQRYGLTDRIPETLSISTPQKWAELRNSEAEKDRRHHNIGAEDHIPPLNQHIFPDVLRRRPVSLHRTVRNPEVRQIRGAQARIATIGEVFVQMLDRPQLCGGMPHVVEVWNAKAKIYLKEIIAAVDRAPESIVKVRAGYLLEDRLAVRNNAIVEGWSKFAQRGGSRVLDPSRPYVSTFSEKWMLSLNASF